MNARGRCQSAQIAPMPVAAHAGFNVAASLAPRSTTGDVTAFVAITAATVIVVAATRGRLRYPATD